MRENNFKKIAEEIGELLEKKNKDYGSAFDRSEKILKILKPEGIKPEEYGILLIVTRIIDKLFRICNNPNLSTQPQFPESVELLLDAVEELREMDYGKYITELCLVEVVDEILEYSSLAKEDMEKAFTPEDPFGDISGYGILGKDKRQRASDEGQNEGQMPSDRDQDFFDSQLFGDLQKLAAAHYLLFWRTS